MKKLLVISLIFIVTTLVVAPTASAQYRGQKTIGVEAGYTWANHSALAGIEFTYRFSRHFRLAPDVNYVFQHNGSDALRINLDAEMPIPLLNDKFEVYSMAGVNFTSCSRRMVQDWNDATDRINRFGINVGAGAGWYVVPHTRVGVSAYYTFIKDVPGLTLQLMLSYSF